MSDYEGEGWTAVELSSGHGLARVETPTFTDYVAPKGRSIPHGLTGDVANTRKGKQALRPGSTKPFHPLLQNIRPRAYHGTGGRPVEQVFELPKRHQDLASYRSFLANPDGPSDVYELDISWGGLLRAIPDTTDYRSRDIARNNLDSITTSSEAFLKTPELESPRVEIWGTPEQCQEAKTRLRAWEIHLRSTGLRPSQKTWIKGQAFDGRREDRLRQEQWQKLEEQALQEADDDNFEFEAYLIWPAEYDLDAYIKKYESNTLREIAREFSCRFKHDRKVRPRLTRIQAQSEEDLLSAYQRLINLAKEMIALRNRGTHGNFCRLPSPDSYRDQVIAEKISDTKGAPHRIMLSGNHMADEARVEWVESIRIYQKQNRAELQSSMDAFFKALYVSQCHIRLRVSFGDSLLRSFTKSKSGSLTFDFDEFLMMLQGRRTELHDPKLLDDNRDIGPFVDKLMQMDQLQYPEESYRQIFEFKGEDSMNRLRLEIEMQPGYDFDEPQVCGQRWLTFRTSGQNENVLGLRLVDFERPGYMIRADSYDLFTNDNIIRDLVAFRNSVSFKPVKDGIKAYPKLRSVFTGHNRLMAVTEFTSIKFQFKDTDGIVELRREDIYLQDSSNLSKLPNNTRYELFYYYPEWDSLLGDFSNIKPGEDVTWRRSLTTFFPTHVDPDRPRSLPKGFKAFLKEVHEIQDLVCEGLVSCAQEQSTHMDEA